MKPILFFLALNLCAAAQTLVGLPQHKIQLTGTPERPIVINNSGKSIIGTVLLQKRSDGLELINRTLETEPGLDIPNGGSMDVLKAHANRKVNYKAGTTIVSVALDLVIFSDGLVSGPDTWHNFDAMEKRIASIREVGMSGFTQIQLLANSPISSDRNERDKQAAARTYLASKKGDDLLKHYRGLPEQLRKEN